MILSMTGFGRSSIQINNAKVNIEIKSVNSKQLDLNFRLNNIFRIKGIKYIHNHIDFLNLSCMFLIY